MATDLFSICQLGKFDCLYRHERLVSSKRSVAEAQAETKSELFVYNEKASLVIGRHSSEPKDISFIFFVEQDLPAESEKH